MKFVAFERTLQGTGASRRLRVSGKVPGIVFGAGIEPAMVEMDHNALFHALKKEAFHSTILEMELAGARPKCCCVTSRCTRTSRKCCTATSSASTPRPRSPRRCLCTSSVKTCRRPSRRTSCTVNHVVTELLITCLAQQLPEFIEVDLSGLTLGHSLHVNDLKLPAGVKVVVHGKPNPAVATAVAPVAEEVIVVAAAPVDDGKKKKKK